MVGVHRYVNRGKFECRLVDLFPPSHNFLQAGLIIYREPAFCSHYCWREIHASIRESSSIDGSCFLYKNFLLSE